MIPANDFKKQWAETAEDVLAAVSEVGESGWYILGGQVSAFEHDLASFWGIPHAVGVASGLDALEISLRALGCGKGDKVLTSPISAFATTLSIVKLAAVPVFADCDSSGLIDLAHCRRILAEDPSIRYFVPVHLYGHALDMMELDRLKSQFNLRVVEDCAQSIGADHRGLPTGSVGNAAATSFYPTKNLGAIGDGGAILTADEQLARQFRALRDYGQIEKYRHHTIGYNSRLDELQAAILRRAFMPRLSGWIEARRRVSTFYRQGITNPAIRIAPAPDGSNSSCHLFPVLVEERLKSQALMYFKSRGISTGEHYPLAINEQPALRDVAWVGITPRAAEFCRSEISLPIHPFMTDHEVALVVEACNSWTP